MIEGILIEGLIYGIMALGVFITFRVLDFPDLTVDGSFPLGAVILAMSLISGINPVLGLLLAFLGGVASGLVTAFLHNKLKIPHLLAGILTMTMLYSINIRILDNRANLSLLNQNTLFNAIATGFSAILSPEMAGLAMILLLTLFIKLALDVFFHTDLGITLKALGNNEQMVISQGVNPETLKLIGVGLSNGLVALSGAIAAQFLGFADVGMGQGIVIAGLASVMLGEFLFRTNKIWLLTLSAIVGSILYKAVMYLGREYGYAVHMTPSDLKLITGVLVVLCIVISKWKMRNPGKASYDKT